MDQVRQTTIEALPKAEGLESKHLQFVSILSILGVAMASGSWGA